jgi:glycosyltransferase involved in cell wall biosynthesis
MRRALFYLTYNGIYNFTNGIGTQTQLLLRGLERLHRPLAEQYGLRHLHVVCPRPDSHTWGYDAGFFRRQRERLRALHGQLHLLPYKQRPHVELWDVGTWHHLCARAGRLLAQQSQAYDDCLLICIDQPWLHMPHYIFPVLHSHAGRIQSLLVLYSTAFIRHTAAPDKHEMHWEQAGLARACVDPQVAIADICPSFTTHLQTFYDLPAARFAPYTSSILVDDDEFQLRDETWVTQTLQRYRIPLDRDLIVAFGRAVPLKGFETLIPALDSVREHCHFVLISVPYPGETYQHTYDRLLAVHRIRATHIRAFSRELPRALCQWSRTRAVVVPSHQETFSNIPLEVALWARHQGPVVVASRVGGFVDQIEPDDNGFLMDITHPETIAQTLRTVLALSSEAAASIRQRAYQNVMQQYDFRRNFVRTLDWFWGDKRINSVH